MTFSLPQLKISQSVALRQETRAEWEQDFETNHRAFAEELANGIAAELIQKLGDTLKDPFKKPIADKNRLVSEISLRIATQSSAQQIKGFVQKSGQLPPFKAWLETFSDDKNKSADQWNYNCRSKFDIHYFADLMGVIGNLAKEKLSELFTEFKSSDPEHKDLLFRVEWYRRSEQECGSLSSKSSGGIEDALRVELWLSREDVFSDQTEKPKTAVQKYRMKQLQIKKKNGNYERAFMVLGVFMLAMFVLYQKSNILNDI